MKDASQIALKLKKLKTERDQIEKSLNHGQSRYKTNDLRRIEEEICWLEMDLEKITSKQETYRHTPTEWKRDN